MGLLTCASPAADDTGLASELVAVVSWQLRVLDVTAIGSDRRFKGENGYVVGESHRTAAVSLVLIITKIIVSIVCRKETRPNIYIKLGRKCYISRYSTSLILGMIA